MVPPHNQKPQGTTIEALGWGAVAFAKSEAGSFKSEALSELQSTDQEEAAPRHIPSTLAWCRSTPYMESLLAFSKNWESACAGDKPLRIKRNNIILLVDAKQI